MNIVEATGLYKYYGRKVGIENVDLSISSGEIFGFLGPNGAGKTTTIRILVQLLRPDRGSLAIFGNKVSRSNPELHERTGYLPGDFRPYPEMTARQFLDYMARYRSHRPVLRSYLSELLDFNPDDPRPVKHLSHGNRQKLGLLFALEHEPELAILDEPTTGLDPLIQEALYEALIMLREKGTTIFLSSHLLSEVEKVCDRVAVIRKGNIVACESLENLRRRRPRRLIIELGNANELPDLPGARLLSKEGTRYSYLIEGDMNEILRALPALQVREIFLPEPDLEDIFMSYYREV